MRAFVVLAVLMVALLVAHLIDLHARAEVLRAFTWSRESNLEAVLAYAPAGLEGCAATGASVPTESADIEALARALITVESFATSRLRSRGQWLAAHGAWAFGVGAPDLSYGPGRVRLSTAERIAARSPDVLTRTELALRLLDVCHAKAMVAKIVRDLVPDRRVDLDMGEVRRIAAIYNGQAVNGQAVAASPEAAVAHETYQRLVYGIFQHYRFERLQERARVRFSTGAGGEGQGGSPRR